MLLIFIFLKQSFKIIAPIFIVLKQWVKDIAPYFDILFHMCSSTLKNIPIEILKRKIEGRMGERTKMKVENEWKEQ